MGDYCLTSNEQLFSHVMARTKYIILSTQWKHVMSNSNTPMILLSFRVIRDK